MSSGKPKSLNHLEKCNLRVLSANYYSPDDNSFFYGLMCRQRDRNSMLVLLSCYAIHSDTSLVDLEESWLALASRGWGKHE